MNNFLPGEIGGVPVRRAGYDIFEDLPGYQPKPAILGGIFDDPAFQFGLSVLAHNTSKNPAQALMGGMRGLQDFQKQKSADAYNQQMQQYNMTQAETARMKAITERKKLIAQQKAAQAEGKMFLPGFLKASGIQPQGFDIDDEGNLVATEASNVMPAGAESAPNGFLSTLDPDMRAALEAGLADPKTRGIAYRQMFDMYKGQKKIGQGQGKRLTNVQQGKDGKMYGLDPELGQFVEIPGRFQPAEKQPLVKIQGPFNEGEKGFKHELSLRSDFRQEPMYKAYQQVESAYRQINAGLEKISPAGDMAAATKVMKLLDPESVVRESELAMAMEATGLLDRITSYADRTLKGEKLTPNQRKDFRDLADKLFDQAAESYNAKRNEYVKIAKDYGFDPERAFGKPAMKPRFAAKPVQQAQPAQPGGWSIKRKD